MARILPGVLLTALAAADLGADGATCFQNVQHRAVAFTWRGCPVRILFNSDTGQPTDVEPVRPIPAMSSGMCGAASQRAGFTPCRYFEPGGLHDPRQVDIEKGGCSHCSPSHLYTQASPA